jgi:hypothetical protein
MMLRRADSADAAECGLQGVRHQRSKEKKIKKEEKKKNQRETIKRIGKKQIGKGRNYLYEFRFFCPPGNSGEPSLV